MCIFDALVLSTMPSGPNNKGARGNEDNTGCETTRPQTDDSPNIEKTSKESAQMWATSYERPNV